MTAALPRTASAAARKRVLLVQPSLQPPGGGNAVAVWMIEALKRDCALTVLTTRRIGYDAINRYYGTALVPGEFRHVRVPAPLRAATAVLPTPATHLQRCLILRVAQRLAPDFDVILTANNEADFGRPGIQYIHFPWNYFPRPPADLRWYHVQPLLALYYAIAARLLPWDPARVRANLTLVNSRWTGGKVAERHGLTWEVVYPPVGGTFPAVPWVERENGFVSLGRVSPEKRLELIIEILAAVRARHPDVHLHIIGSIDGSTYGRRIRRLAARHRDWVTLDANVSRARVEELLARHRYGLHGMPDEHFGIAVAEMSRAGCIPFVAADGGQVEIVGDDRLIYTDAADAVAKIDRVLSDAATQDALRTHLAARQTLWSREQFITRIQDIVARF